MKDISRRGFVGAAAAGIAGVVGGSVVGGSAAKSWASSASAAADAHKWISLDNQTITRLQTVATQLSAYAAIHRHLVEDGFRLDRVRGERADLEKTSRRPALLHYRYAHVLDESRIASLLVWWKGRHVEDVRAITRRLAGNEAPDLAAITFEDPGIKKETLKTTVIDGGLVTVDVYPDGDHCMGVWVSWCVKTCDNGGLDPECYGTCMFRCGTLSHPVAKALCAAACEYGCEYPPYCCDYDGQSMRACY